MQKLRPLSFLLALVLLPGCTLFSSYNTYTARQHYRKVRVTDVEGHLIADWISEGSIWHYEKGYQFKAVERRTDTPYPQLLKYPHGRMVIVNGPNIVIRPCGKPEWLYRIDGF